MVNNIKAGKESKIRWLKIKKPAKNTLDGANK
jgi:hypothetical protein